MNILRLDRPFLNEAIVSKMKLGELPRAFVSEKECIGGILQNPNYAKKNWQDAQEVGLKATDFYDKNHAYVWRAFERMEEAKQQVTFTTLNQWLESNTNTQTGKTLLAEIGGIDYLKQFVTIPLVNAFKTHAQMIKDTSTRRAMIVELEHAKAALFDTNTPLQMAIGIADHHSTQATIHAAAAYPDAENVSAASKALYENLLDDMNSGAKRTFNMAIPELATHFRYKANSLAIVAGGTGSGKSAFLLNEFWHAMKQGRSAAIILLEMTTDIMMARLWALETGIPYNKILWRSLSPQEVAAIGEAQARIDNYMQKSFCTIIELNAPTMSTIENHVRRLVNAGKLDLLIIDYIHNSNLSFDDSRMNDYQNLKYAMTELERWKKDYQLAILTAMQLNALRASKKERPELADIEGGGIAAQKAELVAILHRPCLKNAQVHKNLAELIVAKNRTGQGNETFEMHFEPAIGKFNGTQQQAEPALDLSNL